MYLVRKNLLEPRYADYIFLLIFQNYFKIIQNLSLICMSFFFRFLNVIKHMSPQIYDNAIKKLKHKIQLISIINGVLKTLVKIKSINLFNKREMLAEMALSL